jgi:lysozyme family protein
MRDNLMKTTEWILVHEGGYVNHPKDPGGPTNMGVTQRVYDSWRVRNGKPKQSVRNITKKEVISIYKDQYWDKIWGDFLPSGLDYSLYDFAVNSGPTRAIKFIQRLVGVKEDGVMGNVTLGAILSNKNIEKLIIDLNYARWNWLKKLRHFSTFGKGWTRRVMGEKEGVQERDHGVIDRSILLYKQASSIPAPKNLKDGSGVRTEEEPLKLMEEITEGLTFDNVAKIGAGSLPAWLTAAAALPEGPLQWAFAAGTVMVLFMVALWLFRKLK